ncbi:SusC/RagA family TonB-linked outer membrane protein [Chryseobacterium daeguense]|uniref:SusC/RagA family TonB-linked outer membrane protein n=1 Tax=Chryseobacterium daeguense TaxID=412438 RepID=UPI0004887FC0|nr:SusC/RagA family TonB-linked outer membrane protein [Chryseobacterium daeguense]
MKQSDLKYSCLIAVLYFGMNVNAQTTPQDTVQKEQKIEEVVMIGYGTAKKRDLTGSISRVSGSEVADKPNANPVASLQGKVAGLSVVNQGQLGGTPDVRIRGTVSRYNAKPLYVVDGIFADNLDFVNPNDIESMEVLKDASSLAIFGNKGANGVIIVTTKKGKTGTTVNFNSSYGVKFLGNKPELTNGQEFRTLFDEQRQNQGIAPYQYYNVFNANTDWIDLITNNGAPISNNNISFNVGSEKNKFYLGLGYLYEEGIIESEKQRKITLNINDEFKINDNIKVGVNLSALQYNLPRTLSYTAAINTAPIASPYNEQLGIYNQLPNEMGAAQLGNLLVETQGKANTLISQRHNLIGSVYGEIRFLKNFTFRSTFLGNFEFNKQRQYYPVFDVYVPETGQITRLSGINLTSVRESNTDYRRLQQNHLLTYDNKFGSHNVTAMVGFETIDERNNELEVRVNQSAKGQAIPWDRRFWYVNNSFADPATLQRTVTYPWDKANVSYFGRVLYNYAGKYMLNASFRRDGSSAFSSDNPNQYQNFWAIGGAWEISKENFMDNQKIFNYLKVKGSAGKLGNEYAPVRYPNYPGYVAGSGTILGVPKIFYPASTLAYVANPNLKWEEVYTYEGGLELSTLNRRLSFEGNYYTKRTKDLLVYVETDTQDFFDNAGEIENKGFEFKLDWNDKIGENIRYSIGGNLTTIKNKVLSVYQDGYELFSGPSITRAGAPIGSFYGYVVEGVYQTNADVLLSPTSTLGTYGPGDLKFKDMNGDGKINEQDRTIIGNPTPDFTYAFYLNFEYKNFSFSADFQGVYGNEVWRNWGNGSTFAQFNYRSARLDRWNGPGTSNWEPQLNDANGYNRLNSTYMIEDGSYLRLRNIQLGYSFSKGVLDNFKIRSLKFFINAQNLFTWGHNSGFTPEAGGSPVEFGVDGGGYPLPIVTTMGVNITF